MTTDVDFGVFAAAEKGEVDFNALGNTLVETLLAQVTRKFQMK